MNASAAGTRSTDSPGFAAGSQLFLTVGKGTGNTPLGAVRTLTCDPDGGSHPHATKACDRLREVDGDFSKLQPKNNPVCPTLWSPVTVTAIGTWKGRSIGPWQKTYENKFCLHAATNPVFEF
ncbi:hypothetical protein H074_24095 [Amycolatopsis decaplanina DSM 44594]|uniref:Subtilisin inhibitor domain-containing protein n=1 Tax=Amycolatopsis decaplanina DSM 44594 TaxID=1284240 RepID=M2Y2Q4_9PSEU|nr:hypothetical protein H074_24095 [Amycolatopsis decaplanina DSM 44594]